MNKSYLIVPIVLLVVFAFFYNGALNEMKTKEETRLAAIAKIAAADAARKAVFATLCPALDLHYTGDPRQAQ